MERPGEVVRGETAPGWPWDKLPRAGICGSSMFPIRRRGSRRLLQEAEHRVGRPALRDPVFNRAARLSGCIPAHFVNLEIDAQLFVTTEGCVRGRRTAAFVERTLVTASARMGLDLIRRTVARHRTGKRVFWTCSPPVTLRGTWDATASGMVLGFGAGLILGEVFSKLRDFLAGRRPVRVAGVAVEHQRIGLQLCFEFIPAEGNGLVVVVRTNGLELQMIAHEPPGCFDRSRPATFRPKFLAYLESVYEAVPPPPAGLQLGIGCLICSRR